MSPAVQNLILHEIVSPTVYGDVLWVPPIQQTRPYSQQTELQSYTEALAGAYRGVAEGQEGGDRTSQNTRETSGRCASLRGKYQGNSGQCYKV